VGERGTRGCYGLLENRDVGTGAVAAKIFLTERYFTSDLRLRHDGKSSGKNAGRAIWVRHAHIPYSVTTGSTTL
jgi:hypothetical protein